LSPHSYNRAAGPVKVKINWKFSSHNGYLSSDKPVKPPLDPPKPVGTEGSIARITAASARRL